MPNPFRKHSHSRSAKRRGANRLKPPAMTTCKNCGATSLPHRVCTGCGYYQGQPVLVIKAKKSKDDKK